jgi:predicted ArsR family transcriptional regulator
LDLQEFEEIENKTAEIIKRVGIIKPDWLAKELGVPEKDAREVLEALRHRGDLAADNQRGSYHRRKVFR